MNKNQVLYENSHSHSHSDEIKIDKTQIRKIKIVLSSIIIPLLIVTIIGIILLLPTNLHIKKITPIDNGSEIVNIKVESLDIKTCVSNIENKDLLQDAICGKEIGTNKIIPVHVPKEILRNGMKIADNIKTIKSNLNESLGTKYIFWDYDRQNFMIILSAIYLIAVIAVARFKGLAAIFGLITSVFVIVLFIIPSILQGNNPLIVVTIGALLMIFLSVYLAHGISIRTTTALLGTLTGIIFTFIVGFVGVNSGKLSGAVGEEAIQLSGYFENLNLQQILICSIVISSLGALNDVTITQASAVWEIYSLNPTMNVKEIFKRAMVIGKDHIASTVYTLAFAYVGTAFTTILLVSLVDRNIFELLMSYHIAEEIIRTLISSIGLILAIPLTTLLGAILAKKTAVTTKK